MLKNAIKKLTKTIGLILITLWLTACSPVVMNAGQREVPTQTMELILTDVTFQELIYTFDEEQDKLMKSWLKDSLIPYVSYLENELQYSTPSN